jgi:hypothetical protein
LKLSGSIELACAMAIPPMADNPQSTDGICMMKKLYSQVGKRPNRVSDRKSDSEEEKRVGEGLPSFKSPD